MKYRTDYVTNSSSSSFIIAKRHLTDDQIYAIQNHGELAERLKMYNSECEWNISENDDFIAGYTYQDNFSMSDLFNIIGVNRDCIRWGSERFDVWDAEDDAEYDIPDWLSEIAKMREDGITFM